VFVFSVSEGVVLGPSIPLRITPQGPALPTRVNPEVEKVPSMIQILF